VGGGLFLGAVAQLGERLPCTQEVSGSIPLSSTIQEARGKRRVARLEHSVGCSSLGSTLRVFFNKVEV
jgi:hypothetical protein